MPSLLTVQEFVARWQGSTLSERSAAQSHFIDLCEVLGQPRPAAVDIEGTWYTFEKGVTKAGGGEGWADVWMLGHFAWEYKGKHKNLAAAYKQLVDYKDDLDNPPLLVVCDFDRFKVHTNFTNTPKHVFEFTLSDLLNPAPVAEADLSALDVLRALFTDPQRLRPERTPTEVTEAAAAEFAKLAESLRNASADPEKAAHFLMRLLFSLFAEDIGLLPAGLFSRLVEATRTRPDEFKKRLRQLFGQMAAGGYFGVDDIAYFDGGLFADDEVLDLTRDDMQVLARACTLNWARVEPAIFGTLFERSLDPTKRAQIGAHYTSREDILLIVEPVLMAPLRREWDEVKRHAEELIGKRDSAKSRAARTRLQEAVLKLLTGFATRLTRVKVLDPACGSGNFLYVSLKQLMNLEKEVSMYALTAAGQSLIPQITPEQLYGIEVNTYAHELAQVVVWIGYIQWLHDNGFGIPSHPILKPLTNIERKDAILDFDEKGRPIEPGWPAADVLIGNPPFLGGNRIRQGLGDDYVEALFHLYEGRVPHFADLVCYWFERTRAMIAAGTVKRAGLLATQGIRGGVNRKALEYIKVSGDIFWAQSDRNWILDGAAVHVSMIGFDDGSEHERELDGTKVNVINADLTATADLTNAKRLKENANLCFYGSQQKGSFDISAIQSKDMLSVPSAFGRYNRDVVKRAVNGAQVLGRSPEAWVIDFGANMPLQEAALYEAPFEYVKKVVYPERQKRREKRQRELWWLHARPSPRYRDLLSKQKPYLASPAVSKHRIFLWLDSDILADHALVVFARDDDYFFGILQSGVHEVWARAMGTQVREAESGSRYTPSTTFETFPFPWAPGQEPAGDPGVQAVTRAARELVELRDAWLNSKDATEAELQKRTLTNLYNESPTWLQNVHRKLDQAVFVAYGWPHDLTEDEILARLLALNLERAVAQKGVMGSGGDGNGDADDERQ